MEYPEESGLGLKEELEIKIISDKEVEINSSGENIAADKVDQEENKLVVTT
jgi:hypothetical protein